MHAAAFAVALLFAAPALAQRSASFPPPTPSDNLARRPTEVRQAPGRPGAFQDLSGRWHAVQVGEYTAYRAYFNQSGQLFQAYLPQEIQAFVKTPGDTLVSLAGPLSDSCEPGGVFAAQLYRGGGLQLVDAKFLRRSLLEKLLAWPAMLVRPSGGAWVRVPRRKAAFQQLFLTLLADDPATVAELRRGRARPGRDAARLLRQRAEARLTHTLRSAAPAHP